MLPKALRDRPDLDVHLHPIWSAFHAVASDRPVGMGLAPIPFSVIDAYARRYGITDIDEFDRLRRLIEAMDRAVLDDARAEVEAERAKNTPMKR